MCSLSFEYQAKNVPEEVKAGFEDFANKKYAPVCEKINESGATMLVHWTGEPQRLRGIIALSDDIVDSLILDGLSNEFLY